MSRNPRPPRKDWLLPVCVVTWVYPCLLVTSLYGTWLVAWAVLGHQPVPSIDDPKYISPIVSAPYFASAIVLMGFPPAFLLGLILAVVFGISRRLRWTVICAMELGLAALWFATIAFVRWDPLRVMEWWID